MVHKMINLKWKKNDRLNRLLQRRQKLYNMISDLTKSDEEKKGIKNQPLPSKAVSTPSPKDKGSDSLVSSVCAASINDTIMDSDVENSKLDNIASTSREHKLYLSAKKDSTDPINSSNKSLTESNRESSMCSASINDTIMDSDIENSKLDNIVLTSRERKLYLSAKKDSTDHIDSSNQSTTQQKGKRNVTVYSSSEHSDIINTSTLSLELSHSFFTDALDRSSCFHVPGVDQLNCSDNYAKTQQPPKKRPKIDIISTEKIEVISKDKYLRKPLTPIKNFDNYEPQSDATYTNLTNIKILKKSESATRDLPNIFSEDLVLNYGNAKSTNPSVVSESCTAANVNISANSEVRTLDFNKDVMISNIPPADNVTDYNLPSLTLPPDTSNDRSADWNVPSTSRDYPIDPNLVNSLNSDRDSDGNRLKSAVKKRPKRKRRPIIKRQPVDYMSDDEYNAHFPETGDFSDGSSDVWSEKESDVSDSSDASHTKQKRRKKQNAKKKQTSKKPKDTVIEKPKFKKDKPTNKRKLTKAKREKGESYETTSGKAKGARVLQCNPCVAGKCPRTCFNIPEDRRQKIFEYFWDLDIQRKRDWLVHSASRMPIKRKKTKTDESKRQYTYEYYINEGEGRKQVCQQFLLKTLDISQTFLLYTLSNAREEGLAQEEKRRQPTSKPKYDEATVNSAKEYIESLPLLPSHYCRNSSKRLYLPQEFKTLTNLYRIYRKSCEEKQISFLSDRVFINLFKTDYDNVTIHVPKKDKCNICVKVDNKLKHKSGNETDSDTDEETAEKKKKEEEKLKVHMEEKEANYERFKCHQNYSINKDTIVASFDLQKVLNTPHGNNMLLFYSRKYAVYNFTVYENSTQNGFSYVWGESDGNRGSKEIGSCLYKYLKDIDDRGIRKLILYCDSCTGQNRNRTILSILQYFLSISQNVEMIQINYLLSGHTYMPVDSMHAVIEREVRKLTVWSYKQWPSYIESARKNSRPYTVTVMEHHDFIDWDPITEQILPANTKNLQVTKIRIATIKKKEPRTIKVKHSMKEDACVHVITVKEDLEDKKVDTKKPENAKGRCQGMYKGKGKGKGKGIGKATGKRRTVVKVPDSTTLPSVKDSTDDTTTGQSRTQLIPLYSSRLPIALAKYNDLKKLCQNVIPSRFHDDFLQLPVSSSVKDALNQTDEEENCDYKSGNRRITH